MKFSDRVYVLLKKVPKGKVTTYKEIAKAMGTRAYRAVGQALKNNPNAPTVPCHRVVRSDGIPGGYMGRTDTQARNKKVTMLKKEGVIFSGSKINMEKSLYSFR